MTEHSETAEDWRSMDSDECKKRNGLTQVNGVVWEDNSPTHKCPNCGSTDLKSGVATESLKTFDYGCNDCGAVFMEGDL